MQKGIHTKYICTGIHPYMATNRQAEIKEGWQTNKQCIQAGGQAHRHTCSHTYIHTDRHTHIQTNRHARRDTYTQASTHAYRLAGRAARNQTYRQTHSQACNHTHMATERHAHIHAYIQTWWWANIETYIQGAYRASEKQPGRQKERQANIQCDVQPPSDTDGQVDRLRDSTGRHTNINTGIQPYTQADRVEENKYIHTDRMTECHIYKVVYIQTYKHNQSGRKAGTHARNYTHIHTYSKSYRPAGSGNADIQPVRQTDAQQNIQPGKHTYRQTCIHTGEETD